MLDYTMNSHDRIMTAMNLEEADHVPVFFAVMGRGEIFDPGFGFTFGNINQFDVRYPYSYRNQVKKVEEMLALGTDDMLRLEPPLGWAEEYVAEGVSNLKSEVKRIAGSSGGEGTLEKVYHTPEGELRTAVNVTEDWPHGENIPLFSDFSVSRAKEYLIKNREDIRKLTYLLGEPNKDEIKRFREEAADLRKTAQRLGVALEGGRSALGDCLVWLLGIQDLIYGGYDRPDFIEALLDTIVEWESKRIEMLLDEGVEILFHSAWYEISDFWTPEQYSSMLKPRLKKLVKLTQEAGAKVVYIITKSYDVFYKDFLDIGFDGLYGADPVQGHADLQFLKDTFKGKTCLWGGINGAVTLGEGTKEEIEQAVTDAVGTLAPGGGFVLFPVDQITPETNSWKKVKIMLDTWKEIGNYPVRR
jgi:hypothetical protein